MLIAIIKIQGSGLALVEEFRTADNVTDAVLEFCLDHSPALNVSDYLGAGADGKDLAKSWGWDFDDPNPDVIEVIRVLGNLTINTQVPNVIRLYENRAADGKKFFEEQRAVLYLDMVSQVITPAEAFFIENKLKPVKDLILTGDWFTAQSIANALVVEGAYTQAYHDTLTGYINNYVTENYNV